MKAAQVLVVLLVHFCITEVVLSKKLEDVLCSSNVKARTQILSCMNNLPDMLKKAYLECRKSTVPKGGENDENFRKAICKDSNNLKKMQSCMDGKLKSMKSGKMSNTDQTKMKNVVKCIQSALK